MDAIRLFVARARAVDPAFELNEENAGAVGRICERLDGLPLAIELAAARSKLLSPETMSRRLDQILDLLTGGARDLPARQQTLRSTLEWSHELLDEAEQTLFARLAVFPGGWTLDAAEAVCADPGLDVLTVLSALVDENLVRRLDPGAPEPRFGMLETIREYAAEQLARSGEAAEFRARHAQHVLGVAEAASAAIVRRRRHRELVWALRAGARQPPRGTRLGRRRRRPRAGAPAGSGGALVLGRPRLPERGTSRLRPAHPADRRRGKADPRAGRDERSDVSVPTGRPRRRARSSGRRRSRSIASSTTAKRSGGRSPSSAASRSRKEISIARSSSTRRACRSSASRERRAGSPSRCRISARSQACATIRRLQSATCCRRSSSPARRATSTASGSRSTISPARTWRWAKPPPGAKRCSRALASPARSATASSRPTASAGWRSSRCLQRIQRRPRECSAPRSESSPRSARRSTRRKRKRSARCWRGPSIRSARTTVDELRAAGAESALGDLLETRL